MPYQIIGRPGESVYVLRLDQEVRDKDKELVGYRHTAVPYEPGEVVEDENVSPVVVEAYDQGDPHTRAVLLRIDKKTKAVAVRDEIEVLPPEATSPLAEQVIRKPKVATSGRG